jgi:rhodanese-related sulfurtransferase
MQQSGEQVTLIDVRERDEQNRGTIPAAVGIARGVIERDIDQATTNKGEPIVIYCAGARVRRSRP